MTALPAIFNPSPSDNEDVVSALETADIFWAKGDTGEALRWLKRAADTASDAGDDMRALAIARSVADLKSMPTQAAAEAPRMSRPPPPSALPRPAPAAPSASSSLSSTSTEGSDVRRVPLPAPSPASGGDGASRVHTSSAPQKMPPPLPPSKARESTAPPAPSARPATSPPPAPSHSAPSAPTPAASHSAVPLAPTRSPSTDKMAAVAAEPRAPAPQQSSRAAAHAPAASAEPVQSRRSPTTSSLPKEPHRALTPGTAFRGLAVFVKPQGRNGDKLEVIIAKPGQAVPAGAESALLIPTRRGGRLLG
jgi:hypothetical protein